MMKSAAGVLAGFVIWAILWIAYNTILRKAAILTSNVSEPIYAVKPLMLLLFGSVLISAVSGYCCALIARSATLGPVAVLGLLLLAVGIFFQSQYWRLMPLWYHLSFLILLIPLCFVGASLRISSR